jgi:hypothetical protein
MTVRDHLIYPDLPAPQLEEQSIYQHIREGFNYRVGEAPHPPNVPPPPDNPHLRLPRNGVARGRILDAGLINPVAAWVPRAIGNPNDLTQQRGAVLSPWQIYQTVFEDEIRNAAFLNQASERVLAFRTEEDLPAVAWQVGLQQAYAPVGGDGPEHRQQMNMLYAEMMGRVNGRDAIWPKLSLAGQASRQKVGNSWMALVACAIITFLSVIREDDADIIDNEVIRERLEAAGHTNMLHLLRQNRNPLPYQFAMQLDLKEWQQHEYAGAANRTRGINKYEHYFLNPERFIHAPNQPLPGARRNEANPAHYGYRFLDLNDRNFPAAIFTALYRWNQHYSFSLYRTRAQTVRARLVLRSHERLAEDGYAFDEIIGNHWRTAAVQERLIIDVPAAVNFPRRTKMPIGQFVVDFPRTTENNCVFYALDLMTEKYRKDHGVKIDQLMDLDDEESPTFRDRMIHSVGGPQRYAFLRRKFNLPPGPIDMNTQNFYDLTCWYGFEIIVVDSDGEEIINNAPLGDDPYYLMFLSSEEVFEHFKVRGTSGHVGLASREGTVGKYKCSACGQITKSKQSHRKCNPERLQNTLNILNPAKRLDHVKQRLIHEKNDVKLTRKDSKTRRVDSESEIIWYDLETLHTTTTFEVYAAGWSHNGFYHDSYGEGSLQQLFAYMAQLDPLTYDYKRGVSEDSRVQKAITTTQQNKKTSTKVKSGRKAYLFAAWNNARFDSKLLLHYLVRNTQELKIQNVLFNNGRILSLVFTNKQKAEFRSFDPVLFFSCSLKKACSDFGVAEENTKKTFPHKLMRTHEDINKLVSLSTLNDPSFYFSGDCVNAYELKEPWNAAELSPFLKPGGYSLKELSAFYLKADVLGMKDICQSFFDGYIQENQGVDAYQFMTMSSMSYNLWGSSLPTKSRSLISAPSNKLAYEYIRAATYGGRVFVGRREWISPALLPFKAFIISQLENNLDVLNSPVAKFEDLPEDSKTIFRKGADFLPNNHGLTYEGLKNSEYYKELDFYSLYPSVMANYKFPGGNPSFVYDMAEINARFKATGELQMGFYIASHKAPKHLFLPAIPSRHDFFNPTTRRVDRQALRWDLLDHTGFYTSVDLQTAHRAGYEITLVSGLVFPEEVDFFSSYVHKCMNIKAEGDETNNTSLRLYGKLCGNSLYGKLLQALITESSAVVTTKQQFDDFLAKNHLTGLQIFDESLAIIHGESQADPKPDRPYHLGAFVLAYSRKENWDKFACLHPSYLRSNTVWDTREIIEASPLYGDTDSMYVRGDQAEIPSLDLKNALGHIKDEDATDYEKAMKKKEKLRAAGKDASKVSGGVRILWMICINVKTYAYIYITSANQLKVKIASKGIECKSLRFLDYAIAAENYGEDYTRRVVAKEHSLQSKVSKHTRAEDFSAIHSVRLDRTFDKSPQLGRVALGGEDLHPDPGGLYTVPFGHANALAEKEEDDLDMFIDVIVGDE